MLVKFNPVNALLTRDWPFDDFFAPAARTFEPRVDIREDEKEFVVSAELPGLNKKDFKLSVENNLLVLEGEKKIQNEEKTDGIYRSERSFGSFKRTFRLTDSVDAKKISADYSNGILKIRIPKAEKARPKLIEVNVK